MILVVQEKHEGHEKDDGVSWVQMWILKIGGTVGASAETDMVTVLTSMVLIRVIMGILENMMTMVMIMVMVLIVMAINTIMIIKLKTLDI